jgi:hypothetical protein
MASTKPPSSAAAPLTRAVFEELVGELRALQGRLELPDVPLDQPGTGKKKTGF